MNNGVFLLMPECLICYIYSVVYPDYLYMQNLRGNDWMVIVNPNAGKGRGEKDWERISGLLVLHHISFEHIFTCCQKHAITLARDGILNGYRNIVVVGGDGTLNEVVNGVFTQEACPSTDITLALVKVGTGNDWGKMFGIPLNYEEAVRIIRTKRTRLQDVGAVEYMLGSVREKRYFLNIAGLGFDAMVVKRTNLQKEKGKSGKALYLMNLLNCLLQYSYTTTEIDIDGLRIRHPVFTMSIGIGKYSGGGMMQTPAAVPDDGLFDITLIKKISKIDIILSLKKLYDGSILSHPKIEGFRGKIIEITSNPLIHLETDGESLGHSPVRFHIIPRSIQIACNQNLE